MFGLGREQLMTAQLQLLNKILETKDYSVISLNNLTDVYFPDFRTEYNFIKNHYELYHVVPDKLTFANNFPDFDFTEVNEPLPFLLEQLYKEYHEAYLAVRFNNIKKMLEAGKTDEAVNYFMESTENIHIGATITAHDLITDTSRYDHYLEMSKNKKDYYISTGFKELDKLIYGIDRKNEVMVLAARTGVGKSFTLIYMIAAAVMQGLKVGMYSGEMSVDKVGYRFDTIMSGLRNSSIAHGDLFVNKEYKEYIENLKTKVPGSLKVITPNDIAGRPTVSAMQAFIEKEHLDILFIDQYSLLDDESNARQPFEKVANISKAIKRLQVMKQIPIISVSQLNRTKLEDSDEMSTTMISASDRIGQDATTIIMLNKKDDDKLVFNLVKSRDGVSGKKLTYHIDFNTGKFDYIDEDAEPAGTESEEPADLSGFTSRDQDNTMQVF